VALILEAIRQRAKEGVLALCGDVGLNTLEVMFEKELVPTRSLPQGLYLALQGHERAGYIAFVIPTRPFRRPYGPPARSWRPLNVTSAPLNEYTCFVKQFECPFVSCRKST